MGSYTITIAPNDDSGNSTTLIVDTSAEQVRITDVHLHAANGLTGGQLPTVDFGLLLKAVAAPASSPTAIEATPAPAVAPVDTHVATPETADEPTAGETPPPAAATAKPRRAKRAAPAAPAPEPATRSNTRRTAAARTAGGKATKAAAKRAGGGRAAARQQASTKAAKAAGGERAYRRMPEDFAAVYRQASTPAAIADHYGVPRHTAQGWIRRTKAADHRA